MPRPGSLPAGQTSHPNWADLFAAWSFHATGNSGAGCDPIKGGSIGTLVTGATRNDTTGLTDTTEAGQCTLASILTLTGPYSIMWRCKLTTLSTSAMVFGNGTKYVWMNRGTNLIRFVDGTATYEFTVPDANKTVLYDYCLTLSGSSGSQTYKLYYKLHSDTTWTLSGSLPWTPSPTFDITNFGNGFTSLGFIGELHYFQAFTTELSLTTLNTNFADPYDILAGNNITLTAQTAQTRVKIKKASGTYSVTLAGSYSGSGAIEYKFGNGAWTTLVASPSGGTYSQAVSLPGNVSGQGLSVRLANDTSKTASDPLFTIADRVIVCSGDSISDGRLTNFQNHTGSTYTSLKYQTTSGWTECDDPTTEGSTKGSYWPVLANYLSPTEIVCFIATGASGALMSNWTISTISGYVTASGVSNISAVIMNGGANDINNNAAATNSSTAWSNECQRVATAVATAYPGAVTFFTIPGDVSSLTGKDTRATATRKGVLEAAIAAPTTCKIGANVWWRELTVDHLHPVTDAEGLDYSRENWQVVRIGATNSPTIIGATHNTAKDVITVRFDQALRTGTTLTPACFQVYDNGVAKTISTAAVTGGDRVALTLSSACTSSTITVSMGEGLTCYGTPPQGTALSLPDSSGNFFPAALPFFDISVTPADETAPVLSSAVIGSSGTTLTLTFTETGSAPIVPIGGITGFTLTASGGSVTLPAGSRTSSTELTFALSRRILQGETVTVSYSGGNVYDSATTPNALATITNSAVTNNSTQTASSGSSSPQTRTFSLIGSW